MGADKAQDEAAERGPGTLTDAEDGAGVALQGPVGDGGAETLVEVGGVLDARPPLRAADVDLQGPVVRSELVERGRGVLLPVRRAPLDDLLDAERTELAQQVGDALGVGPRPPLRHDTLQLGLHLGEDVVVEEPGDAVVSHELGEDVGVEREEVGGALGVRQVPLVEQRRGVAEDEGPGEGGR